MTSRDRLAAPQERFARDMAWLRGGGLFGPRAKRRAAAEPFRPQTGDVLLRLLAIPESIGLASSNLSGYSHCGVIRQEGGQTLVEDCYPALHGHAGGARRTPLAAWTRREGPDEVLHWLALRHPDIDPDQAARGLDALVASRPRFALVLEAEESPGRNPGAAANCAAFVRAFLEGQGLDCSPALAATTVTTRVLTRFFDLVREGFYQSVPGGAGGNFYALATAYGFTTRSACPPANLPPGFCELLPGFFTVGYGQNEAVPPATRRLTLAPYARLAPGLRGALACHGLLPETARHWLDRRDDWGLRALVRAEPPQAPLCGTRLAIGLLLALAARPEPYLTIPLATHFGLGHPGPVALALVTAALRLAPPVAALAWRLGLPPFHLFNRPPRT